jgi:hypothetical protein
MRSAAVDHSVTRENSRPEHVQNFALQLQRRVVAFPL